MCQSKANGGRRCTGLGKNSSFYPEHGNEFKVADNTFTRLRVDNLITTTGNFNATVKALNEAGLKNAVAGEQAREAVRRQMNGETPLPVKDIYAVGSPQKIKETLMSVSDVTVDGSSFKVGTGDDVITVHTADLESPYSIDSIQYDPATNELVDPHNGVEDIRNGVIRHTEPFKDNPVSVLRASVLVADTGYSVAPETVEEARTVADTYESIPKEKVWKQWSGLALSKEPSKALQTIHEMGWEKNFPELANIRDVPQSPSWHPEGSVEKHIQEAADVAARKADEEGLNDEDRQVVVLGAISHDFGKSVSTVIDEDGKISSAGHAQTGAPISRRFLKGIGAPKHVRQQVPIIVDTHMHHIGEPTMKGTRKLMEKLDNQGKGTTIENWARVAEADVAGRGSAGTYGLREEWLKKAEEVRIFDAQPKILLVNGDFLTAKGYKPSPQYGVIIKAAKEAANRGEISNEEEAETWVKKNFPL